MAKALPAGRIGTATVGPLPMGASVQQSRVERKGSNLDD